MILFSYMNILETINSIFEKAQQTLKEIKQFTELEQWNKQFLGKNSEISNINKLLKDLSNTDKATVGKTLQNIKDTLLNQYQEALVTLKPKPKQYDFTAQYDHIAGNRHPLSILEQQIKQIFQADGFTFHSGEDITTEYYNFDSLNTAPGHPARSMRDTFYLNPKYYTQNKNAPEERQLLRTQTTSLQAKILETNKPPLRTIAYGNVYRRDDDATHTPMFTQLEGIVVEKGLTVHHLKTWIFSFLQQLLPITDIRFRPSFFPFTYASAEVDIKLKNSDQWLELLGCGMVHPKILSNFNIDSKEYQGLAFGLGVERLAMLKWQIKDIRYLYSNDISFLNSFVPNI